MTGLAIALAVMGIPVAIAHFLCRPHDRQAMAKPDNKPPKMSCGCSAYGKCPQCGACPRHGTHADWCPSRPADSLVYIVNNGVR
jgi:hypothetical protein